MNDNEFQVHTFKCFGYQLQALIQCRSRSLLYQKQMNEDEAY